MTDRTVTVSLGVLWRYSSTHSWSSALYAEQRFLSRPDAGDQCTTDCCIPSTAITAATFCSSWQLLVSRSTHGEHSDRQRNARPMTAITFTHCSMKSPLFLYCYTNKTPLIPVVVTLPSGCDMLLYRLRAQLFLQPLPIPHSEQCVSVITSYEYQPSRTILELSFGDHVITM